MELGVKCKYCGNNMEKSTECNPFTGMKFATQYICWTCMARSPQVIRQNEQESIDEAYNLATMKIQ